MINGYIIKNEDYPMGRWRKYHSCCDWVYKSEQTGQEIMFCGLNFDREKYILEFEKDRTIDTN